MSIKLKSTHLSRLFSAHVYGHHVVFDLQTACARHQSPNLHSGYPAIVIEYRSESLLLRLTWNLLTSTKHIVVNIIRVENGLVKYRDTYPGGPRAFFADISEETYVIKHALYVLQTLLADGVVVSSYSNLQV
jgi:hypothetical protein